MGMIVNPEGDLLQATQNKGKHMSTKKKQPKIRFVDVALITGDVQEAWLIKIDKISSKLRDVDTSSMSLNDIEKLRHELLFDLDQLSDDIDGHQSITLDIKV